MLHEHAEDRPWPFIILSLRTRAGLEALGSVGVGHEWLSPLDSSGGSRDGCNIYKTAGARDTRGGAAEASAWPVNCSFTGSNNTSALCVRAAMLPRWQRAVLRWLMVMSAFSFAPPGADGVEEVRVMRGGVRRCL